MARHVIAGRLVMPGLDPGIHGFAGGMDGRVKPGHDGGNNAPRAAGPV